MIHVMRAVFLLLLIGALSSGVSIEPRCLCIAVERRRIGKLIERIEVLPPNPHCAHTEIIATLKKTGKQICLDTNARWVKRIIDKALANRSL